MKFLRSKHRQKKSGLLQSSSGFTLLETLIALAIMIVAFSAIFMVESGSLNASAKAREMGIVAMLAKNAMTDTEIEFQGRKFSEVKEEENGNFQKPYERFKWKREIKEIEFPNFTGGAANEEAASESREQEIIGKMISKYLSDAIREVTVTVSWEKGEGEQSFSISQYWVDLNSEFKISQ